MWKGSKSCKEACWIESKHQERLRAIQREMEQLRQHQELLHQANDLSPSILSLRPVCQGPEPLPTASVSPGDGAGSSKHGSAEEGASEQLCNELSYKKQKILLTEEQEFCAPMDGIFCTQHKTYVLLMGRDV